MAPKQNWDVLAASETGMECCVPNSNCRWPISWWGEGMLKLKDLIVYVAAVVQEGGNIWVVCQVDCLYRKQLPMIKKTESRLRAGSCWAVIIAGCPSWGWLQLLQLQNVLVLSLVTSCPEKYPCSVHLELLCGATGQWPPGFPWLMAVACSKWNNPYMSFSLLNVPQESKC